MEIRRITLIAMLASVIAGMACTSAIVRGSASLNGKPMLWKHRDTGTQHNFIDRIEPVNGNFGFVALFNGGDSLRREAWMGMNDAGFAIMNTASYNLAPDTAKYKDMEGVVMRRALEICRTVDDFRNLLDTLPKPMGVQANFGVIDMAGNGGYFETNDYTYRPYLLSDTSQVIIRTNFSVSGNDTDGMGYIRFGNASHLLADKIAAGTLEPADFTEGVSRSFYHSLLGQDVAADTTQRWAIDQDFVPRYSSSASIVIVGGDSPDDYVMWTVLGYPPVSEVYPVRLDDVPADLLPTEPGLRAKACNDAIDRKAKAFPIRRGSGRHYIDMDYVRRINAEMHARSLARYQAE